MTKIVISFLLVTTSLVYAQDFEGKRKINGTNLYLSIKGRGPTVLVIHGGPGLNQSYFKPHLQDLEKNFKMVYFDQRACGKSDTPSPDSISLKFFVDDIEALRKHLHLDKMNILAHSWGAVPATHYALTYPERVNKIIYSNPSMLSREFDEEAAEIIKRRTTKQDSIRRAQIISSGNVTTADYEEMMYIGFRPSAFDRENLKKLTLDLPDNFVTASSALFTGLMKDQQSYNLNLYDSLITLPFQVLIIHGTSDAIPHSSIEKMKNSLLNPELAEFTRSGHFPFVEENEKYLAVVTTFLKDNETKK